MKTRSFSTRLSLNVLVVVALMFAIVLLVVAISSHIIIAEEATKSADNRLHACISDVEKSLNSIESAIQNAAWFARENFRDEEYLYHITRKIVEENPIIIGSTVAFDTNAFRGHFSFAPYTYKNPSSWNFSQQDLSVNYNYFDSEWFRNCIQSGKPLWSEPYFDEGGGECMMSTYSYPIKDSKGRVFAVITADIGLEWLGDNVRKLRPYEHSIAALVSKEGKFLTESKRFDFSKMTVRDLSKQIRDPRFAEMIEQMLAGKDGSVVFKDRGKLGFSLCGHLENGWSMLITCQHRDVLKRVSQMNMVLIVAGVLGMILFFILCHRKIRQLTQPLTEFSVSAMSMAKGNFNAQLPEIVTKDEFLKLNNSFKYLQQSITTYIQELRTTTSVNQRMESELNIARTIQQGMLPRQFPDSERFSLYAMLTPAKEVGGDLYDFQLENDQLYFVVGDVSGKGVPAALVMAITQAASRFFFKMNLPMERVVSELNGSVSEGNDTNMFATLFAGSVNLNDLTMDFCNAGHNHIIVVPANSDEPAYFLKAKPNLAIGLFPDFKYQQEQLQLKPGTTLVLYTDGVTEAETNRKELFGDERLLAVTSSDDFRKSTAKRKVESIYNSVKAFTADNEQNDDITILVITL